MYFSHILKCRFLSSDFYKKKLILIFLIRHRKIKKVMVILKIYVKHRSVGISNPITWAQRNVEAHHVFGLWRVLLQNADSLAQYEPTIYRLRHFLLPYIIASFLFFS